MLFSSCLLHYFLVLLWLVLMNHSCPFVPYMHPKQIQCRSPWRYKGSVVFTNSWMAHLHLVCCINTALFWLLQKERLLWANSSTRPFMDSQSHKNTKTSREKSLSSVHPSCAASRSKFWIKHTWMCKHHSGKVGSEAVEMPQRISAIFAVDFFIVLRSV